MIGIDKEYSILFGLSFFAPTDFILVYNGGVEGAKVKLSIRITLLFSTRFLELNTL